MDCDTPYRLTPDGLEIRVKATPKARQNKITGFAPQGLKVQITTAPEKGLANEAIIALLAKQCHVAKKAVHLLAGETSAYKRILIEGDAQQILACLEGRI